MVDEQGTYGHDIQIAHLAEGQYDEVAHMYAAAWRETYEGLLPQDLVNRITPEFYLGLLRAHPDRAAHTLVVRVDGRVMGMAQYEPKARDIFTIPQASELCALYLLRACHGLGIGRLLVEAVAAEVPHNTLVLYVFADNHHALGFYEHMGFRLTGHTMEEDGGALRELEMVCSLAGRCSLHGSCAR